MYFFVPWFTLKEKLKKKYNLRKVHAEEEGGEVDERRRKCRNYSDHHRWLIARKEMADEYRSLNSC